MLELPEPGLYRTTQPYPGFENQFPADVLIFVGRAQDGSTFVVRPRENRRNRWFWGEPTTPLRSPTWGATLKKLPREGFYILPETITTEGGGRWVTNAIVELGYNAKGQGIVFVAEWDEGGRDNTLTFSDKGAMISDDILSRLTWAPILPIRDSKQAANA